MAVFPKLHDDNKEIAIEFSIIKTNRRLTFDITYQNPSITYNGDDDGDYYVFVASNGYQIISRSRMDIQTERLWILGAQPNERSGSMVFSCNKKRDAAYDAFQMAILEFKEYVWGLR